MDGLLQWLLSRGASFIVLMLLEGIAFYLIINFNSPQQAIALETWSLYANRVNKRYDATVSYLHLKEQISRLEQENARLMGQLPLAGYADSLIVESFQDSLRRQRFVFLSANIINKSPQGLRNTFVIDRGYIHGVEKNQGVVTDQGVVGIVIDVTAQNARVLSAWHQDFLLSAGLRNKDPFGSLVWKGDDSRYMQLTAIPEFASVELGDTVETTGFSNVFPSGIVIGTVDHISIRPGDNNYDLRVRLFQNLYSVRHVYVVRDLKKEDLNRLQQSTD